MKKPHSLNFTWVMPIFVISLALPASSNAEPPKGLWTGTTIGPTSGLQYTWRLESKGNVVDVRVSGRLNGEAYPIQCGPGRYFRGQQFVVTCRYLRAAPGIAANTTFDLQAELGGESTAVTYKSGNYINNFVLSKEEPAGKPPAEALQQPRVIAEPTVPAPSSGRYVFSSSRNPRLVLDVFPTSGPKTRFLLGGGNVRGTVCISGLLEWKAGKAEYVATPPASDPSDGACALEFSVVDRNGISVQQRGTCNTFMGVSIGTVSGNYRKSPNERTGEETCP